MDVRVLAAILLAALPATPGLAQKSVYFVGLETNKEPDKKLVAYLQKKSNLQIQMQPLSYGAAVRRVVDWDETQPYLAHMTPYVYVAAEMLGAKFDILATYSSPRPEPTIYHSYFVVNHDEFSAYLNGREATMETLPEYLKDHKTKQGEPARFIYHDKFSTSSYFLPSLYFRQKRIFAIEDSVGDSQIPIQVEKSPAGTGSSFLVQQVAEGKADLAAVWDETKNAAKDNKKVDFVPLNTHIPNDLLVADASLDAPTKADVLKAIRATNDDKDWKKDGKQEVQFWMDIKDAPETLDALGELRRLAVRRAPDVTVDIQKAGTIPDGLLRAVQDGVRLSGTEIVLFRKDLHKNVDITWELETIHDGALAVTSRIGGVEVKQQFRVSFKDEKDLTTRIAALVQSRMDRIRYVWPYEDNSPSVIRDLDFAPEEVVKVQRIVWTDPDRNDYYEQGPPFDARLVKANDSYKLQLSEGLFPRGQQGAYQFEPMSNVAYRVILQRPSTEGTLFFVLTLIFVGALLLAAGGFAWDLRSQRPPPAGFLETHRRMLEEYHRPWRDLRINDSDVLWCSPGLDKSIDRVRAKATPFDNLPVPFLHVPLGAVLWALHRLFGGRLGFAPELLDVTEAGDTAALDRFIKFLVRGERLSAFSGRAMEWDALDNIVRRNLRRLGLGQTAAAAHVERDPALAGMVSRHFQEVIDKTTTVSFFHYRWQVEEDRGQYLLTHEEVLGGDLRLTLKEGVVPAKTLQVECKLPALPAIRDALASCGNDAWLLGIRKEAPTSQNGTGQVRVEFEPIALLKAIPVREEAPAFHPLPTSSEAGAD
jgi:ABC-type phosphate/phosphonate transport system substrate-binding protein